MWLPHSTSYIHWNRCQFWHSRMVSGHCAQFPLYKNWHQGCCGYFQLHVQIWLLNWIEKKWIWTFEELEMKCIIYTSYIWPQTSNTNNHIDQCLSHVRLRGGQTRHTYLSSHNVMWKLWGPRLFRTLSVAEAVITHHWIVAEIERVSLIYGYIHHCHEGHESLLIIKRYDQVKLKHINSEQCNL